MSNFEPNQLAEFLFADLVNSRMESWKFEVRDVTEPLMV